MAAVVALLLAAAPAAPPAALTPEALRARYAGLRALSADVVQVKEGRFWARPLRSRIRLRYTPERIVWETVEPVRASVIIEGDRLAVHTPDGHAREMGALRADPRVRAMLGFIRSLIAVDLAAIERDFRLEYGAGELLATRREGSDLRLFERIRLRFDAGGDLVEMELETPNERTRLSFERIERDPPLPAGEPERTR